MKSTRNNILLLLVILIFSACKDDAKSLQTDNATPVKVKVSSVAKKKDVTFLSVSGKVEAVKSANISTRMMGYVTKITVNVGDKVTKGQLLLSINNTDLIAKLAEVEANITKATASYNNAKKDYERYTALFKDTSATQKELDDMTANYNMAKAELEAAMQMKNQTKAQFSYANIRAPFNGVVTNKFINVGDLANPGMPLVEVESPADFQVMAMVPESEISGVEINTDVKVLLKSLQKTINGKILEVSTSAKNTGGQYLVKIALEKTDVKLLSGMFATTQIPIKGKIDSKAVLIPKEAVITHGQLSGLYTVSQSNTALLRWLRLGKTFNDKVEVLSGLSGDETFILSAEGKLYNGVKILVQ